MTDSDSNNIQDSKKKSPSYSFSSPVRVSRDEMNLAEFPLTVLSTRNDPNLKTLEFKDSIKGKNGELLERRWIITGADKFGLPTASDDEVLLGLLKLTVDDGVRDRKVFFTRYELLRTLKWTTEGRSYSRLQKALDRLSGVRIKASNAFFDNETKAHSTKNFGIIDAYEIRSGKEAEAKTSYFTWSETIFKSFQVGFIKKLDLDFYLDLQSAVAKRLYRYLDKHFWYKSRVSLDLFTLAHEKIGIPRTYQYASSIRQLLDPAAEELIQHGFIASIEYVGRGKGTEVIFTSSPGKPKSILQPQVFEPRQAAEDRHEHNEKISVGVKTSDNVSDSAGQGTVRDEVIEKLVARGIQQKQAIRLVAGRSDETSERIARIIEHFDKLIAQKSPLVSRSPVGFLYRAVERPETFVLVGEKKFVQTTLPVTETIVATPPSPRANLPSSSEDKLLSLYLIEKKKIINDTRRSMDPKKLGSITAEVEKALQKLREFISPSRFDETVHHGVEEKIAKSVQFPEYDEWKKRF